MKSFLLGPVRSALARLKKLERDPRLNSSTVQWLYWASHGAHVKQFEQLMDILEAVRTRALSSSERGLLIDALAVGHTNITPSRVEWTFKYAPKKVREAALSHVNLERLQDSIEEAVIAATPLDPSTSANYDQLWRGFSSKALKHPDAYKWSIS